MVKVREQQPLDVDGSVDIELWLCKLNEKNPALNLSRIREVCDLSQQAEEKAIATNTVWAPGHSSFLIGLEMADILTELHMDEDGIVAAIIYRAVRENQVTLNHVKKQFGDEVAALTQGVLRMAAISNIRLGDNRPVLGEYKDQLEQARRLLISLVDDVRVALIKLAERTCAIRTVAKSAPDKRVRLAREVFDIYAPLAHRLGIGHLKWELEDLAFRYLEPLAYKRIAALLDGKRAAREQFIERAIATIESKLRAVNIAADIEGRAKHIYSIWRKMQSKGISFSEVYDVRAVRILVPTINDCYSALGIIHTLWPNIPDEFDDYIATPKENGYRSLHTAVIGPEGKILEVQIRTRDMHEEAEYGVCSHWRYKKDDDEEEEPVAYEQRIEWLRNILEWQEEFSDVSGLTKELFSEVSLDRIYVFTPEGHVVDMTPGATPVDFAYRVHTEVGHKCRGAKVNGRVTPLNTPLKTGDQVEIIVGDEAEPRREWLHTHLGYVSTSRARAKIKSWFGHRTKRKNIEEGKKLLMDEFGHLGIDHIDDAELVRLVDYKHPDDLYEAIGSGDLDVLEVVERAAELVHLDDYDHQLSLVLSDTMDERASPVTGIGDLKYRIADCCKPVPGDSIVGVAEDGGFVMIHQQHCLQALRADIYGRLMRLDWKEDAEKSFPVNIEITAYDRRGLLYDITGIFMRESANVISLSSESEKHSNLVCLKMVIEVASLNGLLRTLEKIEQVSNVIRARRVLAA